MATDVTEKRASSTSQTRTARNQDQEPTKDGFEAGMEIPTSVLDGRNESFLAADEKREKASTKFFADTGLMALLCRHDRVLWVANMVSAGEKQYYSLALLYRLFQELPSDMSVGVLYDIGCQLHRSCLKWGFLSQYLHRMTFAISVFHAYGHQWPCQVVYHPRKRKGFGLSDGEGCERFWSSIKKLIPSLRVSGVRLCISFSFHYLTQHRRFHTVPSTPACSGRANQTPRSPVLAPSRALACKTLDTVSSTKDDCSDSVIIVWRGYRDSACTMECSNPPADEAIAK